MFDWWWEFLYSIASAIFSLIDGIYKIFLILAGIAPAEVREELSSDFNANNLLDLFFKNSQIQLVFWAFMIISFLVLLVSIIIGIIRSETMEDNKTSKAKIFKKSVTSLFTVLGMPIIFMIAILATSIVLTSVVSIMSGSELYSDNNLSQKLFELCLPVNYQDTQGKIFTWTSDGIGDYYKLSEFNYVIAYLGGCIILFVLAIAAINLVERLISVILLYIVSPFVLAVSPLDDGNRFGIWRDLVISKLIGIAGMIICLYLYFILMNVIQSVFTGNTFLSKVTYLIFAIGGCLAATKGGITIANLVGHSTGTAESQQLGRTTQMVGSGLMAGAHLGASLLKSSVQVLSKGGQAIFSHLPHKSSDAKSLTDFMSEGKSKSGPSAQIQKALNSKNGLGDRAAQFKAFQQKQSGLQASSPTLISQGANINQSQSSTNLNSPVNQPQSISRPGLSAPQSQSIAPSRPSVSAPNQSSRAPSSAERPIPRQSVTNVLPQSDKGIAAEPLSQQSPIINLAPAKEAPQFSMPEGNLTNVLKESKGMSAEDSGKNKRSKYKK